MHEVSLVVDLFEIIKKEIVRHQVKRVKKIKLGVGELSGVVSASLRFAFEVVSKGTPAEGAELIIEPIPFVARCKACGLESGFEQGRLGCPGCGSKEREPVRGKELYIDNIEVD